MTRFNPQKLQQLEYDRHARRTRRRRLFALVAIVGVLCAATPFAVRFARVGVERMRLNRLYRACAQNVAPTTPVFTEDPAEREAIKLLPGYSVAGSYGAAAAFHVPQKWQTFNTGVGGAIRSYGTIFVGERQGKAGKLLYGIDIVGWSRGGPVVFYAHIRSYAPAVPLRLPTITDAASASVHLAPREGAVRISGGKADPADASHFTIDYRVGEQAGVIDGWIKDDGTVRLEPHLFPATAPAATRPASPAAAEVTPARLRPPVTLPPPR